MLLLNYTLPDNLNIIIPKEIYNYSDNERLLLLLFGNSAIQTMKYNNSLKNEDNEEIQELTKTYLSMLKEKDETINSLEMSKDTIVSVYKDLIESEKQKIEIEILKEVTKEKQNTEEKTQFIKEYYEEVIKSLKTEKEKIYIQLYEKNEQLKNIENEKIRLEENNKHMKQTSDSIIENEKNTIYKNLFEEFQIIQISLKNENEKIKTEKYNLEMTIQTLKSEKEMEIIKLENEYKIKDMEIIESLKNENTTLKEEIYKTLQIQENEKYQTLNEKYEKNENTITELNKKMEEIKMQSGKNNLAQDKGKCGENYFYELVTNIFEHMDDFEIIDTTKTGHTGDYLLKFKDFTIMAECKNFNHSKVPIVDLKKFKSDIKSNQHIRIAWMISLNKSISNYDKYPIETEFENGVLYCYINSLYSWENNQENILISCWKFCKEIYLNFFDKENENSIKITNLMKRDTNKKMIAERGRKKIKELKAMVEQLKMTIYELEKDLIEIIKGDIMMDNEDKINSLKTWWNKELLFYDEKLDSKKISKLEIEDILNKYNHSLREENTGGCEEMDLNNFILALKTFIKDEYFSKNKTKNSKKYIFNYKWIV
jgi:hypothetical protein